MLGQLISSVGHLYPIRHDKIRIADFEKVDYLFLKVEIVLPHTLPIHEDPYIEFYRSRQTLAEDIAF